MQRLIGLSLFVFVTACGDHNFDQRMSRSDLLGEASYHSEDLLPQDEIEAIVLEREVEAEQLEKLPDLILNSTQAPMPEAKTETTMEPPKTMPKEPSTEAPKTPKVPQLPPQVKDRLAKCYAQWEKLPWDKYSMIDVREFNVNADRIKRSVFELAGNKPEIVFINVSAEKTINRLDLMMNNKYAVYCVDISAVKKINRLNVTNVCGSKLGVIDIDAGKLKRVAIREICPAS